MGNGRHATSVDDHPAEVCCQTRADVMNGATPGLNSGVMLVESVRFKGAERVVESRIDDAPYSRLNAVDQLVAYARTAPK